MSQVDRLIKGEIYLQCNTEEDFTSLMKELNNKEVVWVTGEDALEGSWGIYSDGVIICTECGKLCYSTYNSSLLDRDKIKVYVSPDHPVDKLSEVGENRISSYIDKLIEYTPNQGDRYRFELYDYEYILAHVGGQEFNLINMITGNLLTSDAFELPKYGIDLIKYAGSAITHVNGNKII